jgi:hypothetical protein
MIFGIKLELLKYYLFDSMINFLNNFELKMNIKDFF